MAQSKDRFERAQALTAALDPIIDTCVRIGISSMELESLVRVAFVRRLAQTLPGKVRGNRGPTHEAIALAAGLNRTEVLKILASGPKSAALRMEKVSKTYSKMERVLNVWSTNHRYLSMSGLPLNLPLELQAEGPSFTELVEKALPGKPPKTVLKELRRRGLVQLLPDEIVRYRKETALPTELTPEAIAGAAEHLRLLGNTLMQSMHETDDEAPREFGAFATSEPLSVPADLAGLSEHVISSRLAAFIRAFEFEFGRSATKSKAKRKGPTKTIGVSVYTWQKK